MLLLLCRCCLVCMYARCSTNLCPVNPPPQNFAGLHASRWHGLTTRSMPWVRGTNSLGVVLQTICHASLPPSRWRRAYIRDVDRFWRFLAHAICSFARGNCGLSWPTRSSFYSKPLKTNPITPQNGRYGDIGPTSGPFGCWVLFGNGGIETGQTQPYLELGKQL